MISVLDFCNRIRTLLDLDELPCLWLAGTEQDDDEACVVATALGTPVGPSDHPDWESEDRMVMRFADRATARLVGVITELPWREDPPEVQLPEEIMDLAVSHHFSAVDADDFGRLVAWYVLDRGSSEWERVTPTELLIEQDCGVLPLVA